MEVKLCATCKQHIRLSYSAYCRKCHNEYQKAYYKKNPVSISKSFKRRRAEIDELVRNAKDKPCADCGKEYPYYVMDFDHLRDKKIDMSRVRSKMWALDTVKKEIAKCDVVCANCHRMRTFAQRTEV